jgi:hypothetical protein
MCMCVLVHAVSHAGSRELHATRLEVRPLQTASMRHTCMPAPVSVYIYAISYLMRMMCMQNMHRYAVQRGSVQRASLEDSTDATTMDWAGMIWRLKGHMALPINFIKASSMLCASRALHAHECPTLCMQSSCMPSGGPGSVTGRTNFLSHAGSQLE